MKFFYTLLFIAGISLCASAQLVYKDVAPTFFNVCSKCHHIGGIAPMPLLNYSQTYAYKALIQYKLTNNLMPPWPPDTNYTRFLHERIITQTEKNNILTWISNGAPAGDTTQTPLAPVYTNQYQLYGTPSLVLKIPAFTSNASSTDSYVCFSLSTGLTQDRYIRAYEIVPGNSSIVHHVIVNADTMGTSTNDLSGTCFSAPGDFGIGGFAPGAPPTVFPGQAPLKCGIRIKAGSKIVLQIHYPAGTAGMTDSTKIRIYFYPVGATGIRDIYNSVPLQNWTFAILPNMVQTVTAKYPSGSGTLPVTLSMFATFPHSHKVCTSIVNYAYTSTDTIPLVRINKWRFAWQGYYTYMNLVKVPAGYKLFSSHVYDNTTGNPDNPFNPPQTISAGTSTTQEMLFDGYQYLLYQPGDDTIDIGALLANDTLLVASVNETNLLHIQSAAYPNPFSERIKISYELTNISGISISIYNMHGNKVKNLVNEINGPGAYSVDWNGKNDSGANVPAGIYFYTIRAGKSESSGKIVLMPK